MNKSNKLTTRQLASLLNMTKSNITKMRQKGKITGEKVEGAFYFDPAEICRVFDYITFEDVERVMNGKEKVFPNAENGNNSTVESGENFLKIIQLESQVQLLNEKLKNAGERADLLKERAERAENKQDELELRLEKKDLLIADMSKQREEENPLGQKLKSIEEVANSLKDKQGELEKQLEEKDLLIADLNKQREENKPRKKFLGIF